MEIRSKQFFTVYASCSCNRTPHAADWGQNGMICFGACNSIAVYNPKDCVSGCVVATLMGHAGRVNAVRWVRNVGRTSAETTLISASSDRTAIVWSCGEGGLFLQEDKLLGHEDSVTMVDCIYLPSIAEETGGKTAIIAATVSSDSTVRVWERKGEEGFKCTETLRFGSSLCLCVSLSTLPQSDTLLLTVATDDARIHLLARPPSRDHFMPMEGCCLTGHEDWVRSIDCTHDDSGDLLIASASQDRIIRLWRLTAQPSADGSRGAAGGLATKVMVCGIVYTMALETVLSGHEGWVYGVHWHPPFITDGGDWHQPMELLSSSLDRTQVVWAEEEQGGVWTEQVRVGEVGGNTLGFYGGRYGPAGKFILGHSYHGGLHLWRKHKDREGWEPAVAVGGHFDGVIDLCWGRPLGCYLLTVSSDQTTRLHAPWVTGEQQVSWYEMARPQVHGHSLTCIAALPTDHGFVSGAEEKVGRVFTMPANCLHNLGRLSKLDCLAVGGGGDVACGAAVPALGLSNRAVYSVAEGAEQKSAAADDNGTRPARDQYTDVCFTPQTLTEPPTEDTLVQNTLWPEVMKLYGHGYELYSMAASRDGSLVATACKAATAKHAAIMLWETKGWTRIGELVSHQLTVTQLVFSPDDSCLLSVSRDRCWSVFLRMRPGDPHAAGCDDDCYKLIAKSDKQNGVHSRIVWCCAWSHNSLYFATGSRDGKLVVWGRGKEVQWAVAGSSLGEYASHSTPLALSSESITAVDFAPSFVLTGQEYLLAIGVEYGWIRLYGWEAERNDPWRLWCTIDGDYGHSLTVKRVAFRPVLGSAGEESSNGKPSVLQLASCGLDHTVKVHSLQLGSID